MATNSPVADASKRQSAAVASGRKLLNHAHQSPLDKPHYVIHCCNMIKTITKIGNSRGIILDSALLELANLKEGDKVNISVHSGGTITMTPDKPRIDDAAFEGVLEEVLEDYSSTLEKLS